ncbi:MAG: carbamoyltransferase C-terminal domain-containing protein [Gammaproteobacteria bacterium]|nr:carbamoyltransferase C-terminal domain-containing protein [Gammaproteobacteria bacterium]
MAVVLGINAFHGDAAACLLRDGRVVAAVEEERFRRVKHWAGFPAQAIRYCLAEGGLALDDVEHVALNQDSRAHLWRKLAYALSRRPDPGLILERLRNRTQRSGIAALLEQAVPGGRFAGRVHPVEHHLAHMASAFCCSPFDDALVVSVDGFGDFASAAWGVGSGDDVRVDGRVFFPHSLGIFYQAMTQYLGFPHYGDEYKVMGLAAYGRPRFMREMDQLLALRDAGGFALTLDYFRHHRERIDYQWRDGVPTVGTLFGPRLEALLGPARRPGEAITDRHRDIAASVQAAYERALFHLLAALHATHGLDALALAGGCAMNSLANGKLCLQTPLRSVYVQAAPGDAGGALGAALQVWHRLGNSRMPPLDHAYLGPHFSDREIAAVIRETLPADDAAFAVDCVDDDDVLCERVVSALVGGGVVGWFQGRLEWGPRALGNRSILGDPRRADMKDILNSKIKRRESFRPFAPSILRDAVADWFEQDGDVPFMAQVFVVRPEKRAHIPAVTHVDGSGRLHTVHERANPLYHRLIRRFADETGVPMLLNTSFNENEPVVCHPREALDCFLRTDMDVLVIGHWVVRRLRDA